MAAEEIVEEGSKSETPSETSTSTYIVQNAGAATIQYQYPEKLTGVGATNTLEAATVVTLTGFKLNSNYVDTQQALDNSVIVPLLNGGSIQITNNNTCGSLSFIAIRTSNTLSAGDIVAVATAQRNVSGGDSVGATITISFEFDGNSYKVQFEKCTVAECKPLSLAGNDAPDYRVRFNYAKWSFVS